MKVKDLIQRLEKLEPDWEVMIPVPECFEVFRNIKVGGIFKNEKRESGEYFLWYWQEEAPAEDELSQLVLSGVQAGRASGASFVGTTNSPEG